MCTIPLHNLTALNEEIVRHWVTSPGTRGTADILYSCIVTIGLCVYTAVHINIPPPGEHPIWQSLRKAKWTMIGIFAPEIVLYTAWAQFSAAHELIRKLVEEQSKQSPRPPAWEQPSTMYQSMLLQISSMWGWSPKEPPCPRSEFDLTYGYYAVMGGFRADVAGLFDERTSVALSKEGILEFARQGVFFHMNESTIRDKSKADNVAKTLVCIQVLWMVVQCVARKTSGYPLTILEIHTFVHVVCASAMYALWFKKPLNVTESSTVTVPEAQKDILAYMLCRSSSEEWSFRSKRPCLDGGSEIFHLSTRELHPSLGVPADPITEIELPKMTQIQHDLFLYLSGSLDTTRAYYDGLGRQQTLRLISYGSHHCATCARRGHNWQVRLEFVNEEDTRKFRMASKGAEKIGAMSFTRKAYVWPRSFNLFQLEVAWRFVFMSISRELWRNTGLLAAAIPVQMAYGGIHLTAWHSNFPSHAELWTWRASCITVAAFTPFLAGVFLPLELMEDRPLSDRFGGLENTLRIPRASYYATIFCLPLLVPVMLAARVFLVVESFLSLRAVPIGVYAAVAWSSYIPHF